MSSWNEGRAAGDRDPWETEERASRPRRGRRLALVLLALAVLIGVAVAAFSAGSWWRDRMAYWWYHSWSAPEFSLSEEEPADRQEPARAPVGTGVTMKLVSAQGREQLSYQELYRRCVDGVVSVTAHTWDGDYLGTGIIMTEDGYIITNCHVVDDCSAVTITLEDGREFDALLVGKDAQTDLAVLKVEAQGLTALEFGDSAELAVGDPALAIGNPLGEYLRGTLTDGIISAINRDISMNGYSMTLLQTTAALNNGNSGGPLLNIYGQVVGVNNMKIMSDYSTVEGLGFAIPTSVARDVVDELIQSGYVSRAVIGIVCQTVSGDYLERADFEGGVRVEEVSAGARAEDTDLQAGDIIVQANGLPIRSLEDLTEARDGLDIGDILTLVVYRGEDETLTIDVPLSDQRELE